MYSYQYGSIAQAIKSVGVRRQKTTTMKTTPAVSISWSCGWVRCDQGGMIYQFHSISKTTRASKSKIAFQQAEGALTSSGLYEQRASWRGDTRVGTLRSTARAVISNAGALESKTAQVWIQTKRPSFLTRLHASMPCLAVQDGFMITE